MSLQSCAEIIARLQRNPQTHKPTKKTELRSYRDDYIGSEERPCKRFRILVAPSNALSVIEASLPTFTDWDVRLAISLSSQPAALRKHELGDRNFKGAPSTTNPGLERKGWFGSEEAERFLTSGTEEAIRFIVHESQNNLAVKESKRFIAIAEANDAKEKVEHSPEEGSPTPRLRKTTSLIGDPEDLRPLVDPITNAPSTASYGKSLKELFDSKIRQHQNTEERAQLRKWQAQTSDLARVIALNRLSAREIAQRTGRTAGWVKQKRTTISKIISRFESVT
jgi:hypothetical protein